jgi:hypothetical protein
MRAASTEINAKLEATRILHTTCLNYIISSHYFVTPTCDNTNEYVNAISFR